MGGTYNGGSTVIHAGSGWFGKGSVTSQPGEKKKHPPRTSKPKKRKAKKGSPTPRAKGNGLTIPEMIARAEKRVQAIHKEIANTKRRLAALERDLTRAQSQVEVARNTPRKTAAGAALHEAEKERRETAS